jgi:hypothetical protein
MIEHPPDLDSLLDGDVQGPERDSLARVHELLVRAGPLPELPDALARTAEAALQRPPAARPLR